MSSVTMQPQSPKARWAPFESCICSSVIHVHMWLVLQDLRIIRAIIDRERQRVTSSFSFLGLPLWHFIARSPSQMTSSFWQAGKFAFSSAFIRDMKREAFTKHSKWRSTVKYSFQWEFQRLSSFIIFLAKSGGINCSISLEWGHYYRYRNSF